jgi:hypothetical protein
MLRTVTMLGALLASPAMAATITEARLSGDSYALDPGEFTTLADVFTAERPDDSVTTSCGAPADGRRAILKCASDAIPDGRYGLDGQPWIDSADIGLLKWVVNFDKPVSAFGFGVTDAADTRQRDWSDPFWKLIVGDASIDHPRRFNDEGEPVTWYTILFDAPVRSASLLMRTGVGDGYGIVSATTAPVPLPAAGLMLMGAIGLLAAARRRARA